MSPGLISLTDTLVPVFFNTLVLAPTLTPAWANAQETNPEQSKRPAAISDADLPPPNTYTEFPIYL